MPIEYDSEKQMITLRTAHTLYAMQILYQKYPVHLYYGRTTERRDFACPCRYLSFSPYFREYGTAYSPDICLSEFPFFGSGDFRETALKIRNRNGDSNTLFTYRSHRVFAGRKPLGPLPCAQAGEKTETLELTLADDVSGCVLKLYYTLFEDSDVITRYFTLENHSGGTVKIEKCMSLSVDFPRCDFDMISLYGAYYHERSFQRVPLFHGRQSICSRRGASSHQFNPFLALCDKDASEDSGGVYGFNFVYSGNFLDEVEVDQNDTTRVQIGLGDENFGFTLEDGGSFDSPEAVMTYSDGGIGRMSRNFHNFIRQHILPEEKFTQRPVVLNTWEGCGFRIDEGEMLRFAQEARNCGMDMLVMDDGWFGKRNNDEAGLGDWFVNRSKFRDGLKAFAGRVKSFGVKFGIWIEPEMVNPDSDLYRAHPEWCLRSKGRESTLSRNQLVLDMSNENVLDYLKKSFSETFDGVGINYFKWDMNRHLSEVGSPALPPERQDEVPYRYMLGVYDLFQWFSRHFPDAMIENCSGGGGRYDLGMMKYSTQIWASDNTIPREGRIKIQYSSTLAYPPAVMSCHVSDPRDSKGEERLTDLNYRYHTALNGALGYELRLPDAGGEEKERIKRQIEEYRGYEDLILNGDFYRLLSPFETPYYAYCFADREKNRILLTFLQLNEEEPKEILLKLPAADAEYRDSKTGIIRSGAELRHGVTVWTSRDKNYSKMVCFIRKK